jgi:predicted DNA-binding ribbon-helix-helix protein
MATTMDKSNGSNNKSANFSCRLEKSTFSILEEEAESKNVSLNSLINSVLGHYVALDRHAKDIELISLTKRAIKKIFSDMDEKTIKELAREVGGVVHRELVFLKYDKLTFDNLMQVLVINASRYGSVKHTNENSIHKICIHHGACIEFSKFISLIHEIMAGNLTIKIEITNSDQNTVCMEIREPL